MFPRVRVRERECSEYRAGHRGAEAVRLGNDDVACAHLSRRHPE
jgi:hypothetical protein